MIANVAPASAFCGEHACVVVDVGALGVHVGEGRDPDLEGAERADQADQVEGVVETLGVRGPRRAGAARRVSPDRQHRADPGVRVPADDPAQLGARGARRT